MSLNENNGAISFEEVERALIEIDDKYSTVKCGSRDCFEDNLGILSKEFDSLGLPPIDCSQTRSEVFQQVVCGARSLVQIHRRTLSQIKDINIVNKYKESKSCDLHKEIDNYKFQLLKYENKNASLENKIYKLMNNGTEFMKRENTLKEELEKTKRFFKFEQKDFQNQIKRLSKENEELKDWFGKEKNEHRSKDDIVLKLLRRYKGNEEKYKETIQKLRENNKEMLYEILDLKTENEIAFGDKPNCT